jgi:GntR family transcriptional regulator / MocR family aminotransferase
MPWHAGLGAFGADQPAFEEFPFAIWSRRVMHHSKGPSARAIRSIDPMGSKRLREALCGYLRTARAVLAELDQITIVSGSQQALQITANVLLDPGAPVWMEESGHRLERNVFVSAGCRISPVPVDDEGLNVAAGVKHCPNARVAYDAGAGSKIRRGGYSAAVAVAPLLRSSRKSAYLLLGSGSGWVVDQTGS